MNYTEYEYQKYLLLQTFNVLSSSYKNRFTSDSTEKVKMQSLVDTWNIKKSSKLLEVGGGTGDLSPFLLEKLGPDGKLFFLDISPNMVARAKKKLHKYNNIQYFCSDITDFISSCSFDSVVVFNTFPHFIDKRIAFSNIYKLLGNNGTLIISHNNSRWSIVGHHKRKKIDYLVSDFPEDKVVFNLLKSAGFSVEVFENNEGYDYYLVIASKGK